MTSGPAPRGTGAAAAPVPRASCPRRPPQREDSRRPAGRVRAAGQGPDGAGAQARGTRGSDPGARPRRHPGATGYASAAPGERFGGGPAWGVDTSGRIRPGSRAGFRGTGPLSGGCA